MGVGKCRDSLFGGWDEKYGGKCEVDMRMIDFIERVIEEESFDLVVLLGD